MPSNAYQHWTATRKKALDEVVDAHRAVGGDKRGRRYSTQQVNNAYVVLLSAQFQGFCRDLHSECVGHVVTSSPAAVRNVIRGSLTWNRALDKGNPNPGNLGSDFGRFGLEFWLLLEDHDRRTKARKKLLDVLSDWRNAIAHQNYDKVGGRTAVRLAEVRQWRTACDRLAITFDEVLRKQLHLLVGQYPWDE